jgi:predicted N-acetyltransferase YhbS
VRLNARGLDDLPEPAVPDGYRVRTVQEADFASRAAAHRSAFHPSRFRDEVYEFVRSTPAYRQDLDCVVEAPDGSIAAYTLAWLGEENGVGELEPVGTHEDHRRRGLGRAVNLFALRRLRDEGATTALVACRGDAAYPIPCKLYESVGFREIARHLPFKRPSPEPDSRALPAKLQNLVRLTPNQVQDQKNASFTISAITTTVATVRRSVARPPAASFAGAAGLLNACSSWRSTYALMRSSILDSSVSARSVFNGFAAAGAPSTDSS